MTRQSLQAAKKSRRQKQLAVRRFVLLIVFCCLLFMLVTAPGGVVIGREGGRQVVVMTGDTLWSLASAYQPKGRDIRDYVDEIIFINRLPSPVIHPGQALILP
jgi:hypothetical protein